MKSTKNSTVNLSFQDIIGPQDLGEFESLNWENQIRHIRRRDKSYYNSLITIDDVDQILDLSRPNGRNLRVVKNQEPISPPKYENADGSLNLNQIYAYYADGYTVVINEINRFWLPLKRLCNEFQNALSHKTVANMYLTPKNQKALAPHYDTHDVFVLQIHGEKHWKLYEADYQTPILNSFQPIFPREQLKGETDITVSAGDLLYIPRGVPHEAVTTDESSLHLTIGIYPTQWMDVLSKSIHFLAHTHLELRQALPIGFLNNENQNPESKLEMKNKLKRLLNEAVDKADLNGALQFVAEEFRNEQNPIGDGHFSSLDRLEEIGLDTELVHRQFMKPKVQSLGAISRIIFQGNVIKGPAHIAPCFEFIARAKTGFRVGDVPLVNDTNKLKLSKRLVRGGLLKIKGTTL